MKHSLGDVCKISISSINTKPRNVQSVAYLISYIFWVPSLPQGQSYDYGIAEK